MIEEIQLLSQANSRESSEPKNLNRGPEKGNRQALEEIRNTMGSSRGVKIIRINWTRPTTNQAKIIWSVF